jgi:hypothetical protein
MRILARLYMKQVPPARRTGCGRSTRSRWTDFAWGAHTMVTSSWCNITALVIGSVECLRLPTCFIAETVAMIWPERRLCGATCGPTRDCLAML